MLDIIIARKFSLKVGLNKFGEKLLQAVMEELKQLYNFTAYIPMDLDKMTLQKKQEAMNSPFFTQCEHLIMCMC